MVRVGKSASKGILGKVCMLLYINDKSQQMIMMIMRVS